MLKILAPALLIFSANAAHAITCFPLGSSDEFVRVSETELQAKDRFGAKYKVTVDVCPALMMGEPIVIRSSFGELCESDVLEVGNEVCAIDSIERL